MSIVFQKMEVFVANRGVDLSQIKQTIKNQLENRTVPKRTHLHQEFGISEIARSSFLSSESSIEEP